MTFEVKIEADNDDITECSRDDKPTVGMLLHHSSDCNGSCCMDHLALTSEHF